MGNHSHGSPNHSGTVATAGQKRWSNSRTRASRRTSRLAETDPTGRQEGREAGRHVLFGDLDRWHAGLPRGYFAIAWRDARRSARIGCRTSLSASRTRSACSASASARPLGQDPDARRGGRRGAACRVRTEDDRQGASGSSTTCGEETRHRPPPADPQHPVGAVALGSRCRSSSCCGDLGPLPTSSCRTRCGTQDGKLERLIRDPEARPIKAADVTIGSVFHVMPRASTSSTSTSLEEKAKAAVLLMRLEPEDLNEAAGARGLGLRRHRRLLQDLHPRRLPGRPVRAADAPPALPVPPVDLRRHRRTAR